MKIAFIGDTHLGRSVHGYDMTPHIQQQMDAFFDFCVKHEVDMAIHLGDLFDTPKPKDTHQRIAIQWAKKFDAEEIQLYLLVGNHDCIARKDYPTALELLKAIDFENVRVVDQARMDLIGHSNKDLYLLSLPFPSAGLIENHKQWRDSIFKLLHKKPHDAPFICVSHLNVGGASLGNQNWVYRGKDFAVPDFGIEEKNLQIIVNGHIHKHQLLPSTLCLGAALPLTFGEIENPAGFLIYDTVEEDSQYYTADPDVALYDLKLDVTTATNGEPIGTQNILFLIDMLDLNGKLVKLQPVIDLESTVDWDRVVAYLQEKGATHVIAEIPKFDSPQLAEKISYIGNQHELVDEYLSSFDLGDKKGVITQAFQKVLGIHSKTKNN